MHVGACNKLCDVAVDVIHVHIWIANVFMNVGQVRRT